MRCRLIEDIEDFRSIAASWDKALVASQEDNPFLLSDFLLTWWKYYGRKKRLMLFVADDEDGIIGGMPFCVERNFFRNTLVHMGGVAANLTHFFNCHPQVNLFEHLLAELSRRRDWDNLVLSRVRLDNRTAYDVKKIAWSKHKEFTYSSIAAGFNALRELSGGDQAAALNPGKRLRRYLKRAREQAAEAGEIRLERIEGQVDVAALFGQYLDFSRRSFGSRKKTSAFSDAAYAGFFGELLVLLDKKKMLDAHKLTAGNSVMAISFGYRFGKGYKWILTAYEPCFQKIRPGHLLLDFLLKEAANNGDPYFDMYYGGEAFYKQQWCDKMLPLVKLEIYRKNLLNRVLVSLENALRANPAFLSVARSARGMFVKTKHLFINAQKNN